jgi:hypothetical protein
MPSILDDAVWMRRLTAALALAAVVAQEKGRLRGLSRNTFPKVSFHFHA